MLLTPSIHIIFVCSFLFLFVFYITGCRFITMTGEKREPKKGAPVKFVAGSHAGLQGWVNTAGDATDNYTPIIVKQKKSKGGEEKPTRVKHENYVLLTAVGDPNTYEEAMLIQHSDIDQLLTKLVRKMAECEQIETSGEHGKTISKVFLLRLADEINLQNNRGHKAHWRRVIFGNGTR